jgi:hypothetical protein
VKIFRRIPNWRFPKCQKNSDYGPRPVFETVFRAYVKNISHRCRREVSSQNCPLAPTTGVRREPL